MTSALLIDDDVELAGLLVEYLGEEGFDVSHITDGRRALAEVEACGAEIVILDIMMPMTNGIEVLRRIRRSSRIPVLMLTARGDEIDRIAGLDLGADDYLSKPCSPGELAARMRAVLRRTSSEMIEKRPLATITVGGLVVDPKRRRALWHGAPLELTGAEFNLLEVLARADGQLVTREDLSQTGLGRPLALYDRSIDVHLSSVRQKIGPFADGRTPIANVRGQGYQLIGE